MMYSDKQPSQEPNELEKDRELLTKQVEIYTPNSEDILYDFEIIYRVSDLFDEEFPEFDYKGFTLHATISNLMKHLQEIEAHNKWNGIYAGAILREYEKRVYAFNWRDVLFRRAVDWMTDLLLNTKEDAEKIILQNEKEGGDYNNTDPKGNFSSLQRKLIIALCNSGEIILYDKEMEAYATEIGFYKGEWSESYDYKGENIANYQTKLV